jgi:hypothetical protein
MKVTSGSFYPGFTEATKALKDAAKSDLPGSEDSISNTSQVT